jgi:integrase
MASVTLYLDARKKSASGLYTLKIAIAHRGGSAYISTGIRISTSHWNKRAQRIVICSQRTSLNSHAAAMRLRVEQAIMHIQQTRGLRSLSATGLRDAILRIIDNCCADNDEPSTDNNIEKMFALIAADSTKSASTHLQYAVVLRHLQAFDKDFARKCFEDIDREYLLRFYSFLLDRVTQNSASLYMSKLSAVFNRAVDDGITQAYPFRRLTFRRLPTRKRALSVEQLRALLTAQLDERHALARDIFVLSFLLLGINIGDLCRLSEISADGYAEFARSKTKRQFRIKVESEARDIFERYAGTAHALYLLERYKSITSITIVTNKRLKEICAGIDCLRRINLTTYWARHTWATIAARIDISKDTISRALGHSFGAAVTDVYIDYDTRKIEAANRQVIDYVFNNKN